MTFHANGKENNRIQAKKNFAVNLFRNSNINLPTWTIRVKFMAKLSFEVLSYSESMAVKQKQIRTQNWHRTRYCFENYLKRLMTCQLEPLGYLPDILCHI